MMSKRILMFLTFSLLLALNADPAVAKSKKKEQEPQKEESAYEKLFKKKKVETRKGMITLHKTDGKIYFEFPVALMGRDMLLGSTVSEISDNGNALVGQKIKKPLHIRFCLRDSTVELREVSNAARRETYTDLDDDGINRALQKGFGSPVMDGFKVEAWNADSTAVVFDMTDFLAGDNKRLSVFDPAGKKAMYGAAARRATFKKDLSYIADIKAFDDNVSVTSSLSYFQDLLYMGVVAIAYQEPVTVKVNRSLVLLPEKPVMHGRIADPRIGYFTSSKEKISNAKDGVDLIYFAHKWDVRPKDLDAYRRGETVEPEKQIVFYIDDAFPEAWKKPITEGVLQWNKAFEKIGFKNVMAARPFPKDDPEFDPANLKYNCVFYAPTAIANAMGPSWVDPRNNEIINASVFVYHDVIQLVNEMRFIQTAQVDERVRTPKLPEEVVNESLRYIVAHEVGHCLGLMHNMASSAAIPVESYRDPDFTARYGTTPSIMDYARFNYIAQPGDKDVKLTPPELGVYDYYAIEWGYRFFPDAKRSEDEMPMLEKIIADKMGDPMYRYGKQQISYGVFDPTSLTEDLGDDAVKAGEYGIRNLKYIMAHLNEWLDPLDRDYEYRNNIYKGIASQFSRYLYNARMNIGGFYINEHFEGDPYVTSAIVPKEIQRRSLRFVVEQMRDMDWLDERSVVENLPFDGSLSRLLLRNLAQSLLNTKRISLAAYRDPKAYSPAEYLDDIYQLVWKSTIEGREPTECERILQTEVLSSIIRSADPLTQKGDIDMVLAAERADNPTIRTCSSAESSDDMEFLHAAGACNCGNHEYDQAAPGLESVRETAGFDYIFYVVNTSTNNEEHLYYKLLTRVKSVMEKRRNSGSYQTQAHYNYLLSVIRDFQKAK